MRSFVGNILTNYHRFDLICITTNGYVRKDGACVMGAGIAKQFKDIIPELPYKLGSYIEEYGNRCFILCKWNGVQLASFVTKHRFDQKSDIQLIKKSCKQMMKIADKYGYKNIALPKPGCSNGKLRWSEVRDVIEPLLDDRFIICDLY